MTAARLALLAAGTALLAAPASSAAETRRVAAGASIQEALDAAAPGDVVEVEPGVYREALAVDTPDLTLRGLVEGAERPVLDGEGELADGVTASGSPFALEGFRVQRYARDGVAARGVDGLVLSDLVIDDAGRHGVHAVRSRNVTITHVTVTRSRDAAISVVDSEEALVADNELRDGGAGIAVENTDDADVRGNLVRDNGAGILVLVRPGRARKAGRRTRVRGNWVLENDAGGLGGPEPPVGGLAEGVGIGVMGADRTRVERNTVKGNGSVGVWIRRLPEAQAEPDPELDPLPDDNRVGENHLRGNGASPHERIAAALGRGADLAWDGTGRGNCAAPADGAARAGTPLPACEGPGPEAAAAEEAGEGADAVVRIRAMRYQPRRVTVAPGGTVAWVNEDAVTHTVTSGEGTSPTHFPLSSGFLRRGERFVHTFEEPGRYEYLCLPHLDREPMRGATVTVEE